jgi:hypothetical protein
LTTLPPSHIPARRRISGRKFMAGKKKYIIDVDT